MPSASSAIDAPSEYSVANIDSPTAGIVLGTSTQANYVTQDEFAAQLGDLRSLIAQLTATSTATAFTPPEVAANGNGVYYGGVAAPVTQLSNITVNNISGLTASEIPALDYLSLSGGTLSGALNVPTLDASTTNYGLITSMNASSTNFSNFGTAYFGGTATSSFNSAGDLTVAGNTTLGNATSSNFFATTASSTNLFSASAHFGALAAASLSLSSPLSVANGGTGASIFGQGWIYSNGGTGALVASTSPTVNYITATSTTATSTFATGGLTIGGSQFVVQQRSGNVGIGTTNPAYLLDVNGVIGITGIQAYDIPNQSIFTHSMYVGNGGDSATTSTVTVPVDPLASEANGSTNGLYNTLVGIDAGQNITVANQSTFLGDSAGQTCTNCDQDTLLGWEAGQNVTNGYHDTFVGDWAGHSVTTGHFDTYIGTDSWGGPGGSDNDSIGASSMQVTTSGSHNDVMGVNAGENLTAGSDNEIIGASAGADLATSSYNVVIGANAFSEATSSNTDVAIGYEFMGYVVQGADTANHNGNDDVAIGPYSLGGGLNGAGVTTGNFDTALGLYALGYNTTGFNNSAFGMYALNTNSTGSYDIGTGRSSLYSNTTGDYDTGIGPYSGYTNSTGNDNVSIGTDAGYSGTGSANITIGSYVDVPTPSGSGQLNIGDLIYGTGAYNNGFGSTLSSAPTGGNVGIGTSTPYSRLTIWGPDTAAGTAALTISNNASTTELQVFDNGNATLTGTLTQNSDQRLKTNIISLDATSSLSLIDELNPVTFNWIDPDKGTTPQLGFIAQQVLQIFPDLISTTSATALTPDGTLGLNYIGLISPIVSAIQALSGEVQSLVATVQGFAESFVSNRITASQELCVGSTCVTPAQFQAMVAAASQSPSLVPAATDTSEASTTPNTPPTITVNGDNPAVIDVGSDYSDLGATAADAEGHSLDIDTFLNGVEVQTITLDTSEPATDTIDYVATDGDGLTATSTRTVIIETATFATSSAQ